MPEPVDPDIPLIPGKVPENVLQQVQAMPHTSSLPKPDPWSVSAVLSELPNPPQENSSSPIAFFHYLERLKVEKREGWKRFGILRGESIADHMYRMTFITMLAPLRSPLKLTFPAA